ncbi:hypothetical protein OIV83_006517 [Microbotryomycetes sp. JL201]|nr:hypothetical protein OIV83_006517 [Microbotryomycetes sp. JL201]
MYKRQAKRKAQRDAQQAKVMQHRPPDERLGRFLRGNLVLGHALWYDVEAGGKLAQQWHGPYTVVVRGSDKRANALDTRHESNRATTKWQADPVDHAGTAKEPTGSLTDNEDDNSEDGSNDKDYAGDQEDYVVLADETLQINKRAHPAHILPGTRGTLRLPHPIVNKRPQVSTADLRAPDNGNEYMPPPFKQPPDWCFGIGGLMTLLPENLNMDKLYNAMAFWLCCPKPTETEWPTVKG